VLYAGYRLDPESGLYQVRYRHYHPTLGRWIQRDPIKYGGGSPNLYQYVGSSPIQLIDPLGLEAKAINCLRIKFTLAEAKLYSPLGLGGSATVTIEGIMCDCEYCPGKVSPKEFLDLSVVGNISAGIGFGGEVTILGYGIGWAVQGPRIEKNAKGYIKKDCESPCSATGAEMDLLGVNLGWSGSLAYGFASASVSLDISANVSVGMELECHKGKLFLKSGFTVEGTWSFGIFGEYHSYYLSPMPFEGPGFDLPFQVNY